MRGPRQGSTAAGGANARRGPNSSGSSSGSGGGMTQEEEAEEVAAWKKKGAAKVSLKLAVSERKLGFLPVPGPEVEEEAVLLLDPLMCITRPLSVSGVDYCVYVRPSMARAKAALDEE